MLLQGHIPPRSLFLQPPYAESLKDYLALTAAVRSGQVQVYSAMTEYGSGSGKSGKGDGNVADEGAHAAETFRRDGVDMLVKRLRYAVVSSGLRRLCVIYSCLSFGHIFRKLSLTNVKEAESITARAIKDGLIRAVIIKGEPVPVVSSENVGSEMVKEDDDEDYSLGYVRILEDERIYETNLPESQFQQRIDVCVDLNDRLTKVCVFCSLF
jgi:26S proteasome regulatory subunit N3